MSAGIRPPKRLAVLAAYLLVCTFVVRAVGASEGTDQWQALIGLRYIAVRPSGLGGFEEAVLPPEGAVWSELCRNGLALGTKDGGTSGTAGYLLLTHTLIDGSREARVEVMRDVELRAGTGFHWPAVCWSAQCTLAVDCEDQKIIIALTELTERFAQEWHMANLEDLRDSPRIRFVNDGVIDVGFMYWSSANLFSQAPALVLRGFVTRVDDRIEVQDEGFPDLVPGRLEIDEVVYAHPLLRQLSTGLKGLSADCFYDVEKGDHVLAMISFYDGTLSILNYDSNCSLGIRLPRSGETTTWDVAVLLQAIRNGHAWNLSLASERELEIIELLDAYTVGVHRWARTGEWPDWIRPEEEDGENR